MGRCDRQITSKTNIREATSSTYRLLSHARNSRHAFPLLTHASPTIRQNPYTLPMLGSENGVARVGRMVEQLIAIPSLRARMDIRDSSDRTRRRNTPCGSGLAASSSTASISRSLPEDVDTSSASDWASRSALCPGNRMDSDVEFEFVRRRNAGSSRSREKRDAIKDSKGMWTRGCGDCMGDRRKEESAEARDDAALELDCVRVRPGS